MQFLTIKEAMAKYRIGDSTARRWLKSGKLKGNRIGLKWLIEDRSEEDDKRVFLNLFEKSIREYTNSIMDDAVYISPENEIEFHQDKLDQKITDCANLILKFTKWGGGEK
jgi:excisionase family DNA binding protein